MNGPIQPVIYGGTNLNYKIHLVCRGRGTNILVDMPETFSIAMQSEWENRFGQPIGVGGTGDTIARGTGGNIMIQELTRQIWVSSAPIELPVQLIFDANTSAYDDVYKPITQLLEFTVPIAGPGAGGADQSSIITSPGPALGDDANGVQLRVGRMLWIPDGIVTSVQANFDVRLDETGFPIAGQVDMTVRTSQVYSNIQWAGAVS